MLPSMCEALDIPVTPERATHIQRASLEALERLSEQVLRDRRWPDR